jgi:hypothetical protein
MKIHWPDIVRIAEVLVRAETDSLDVPPTLRRVHYLLVSSVAATAAGYRNTQGCYKGLSDKLARARETGGFPRLTDLTRRVQYPLTFTDEQDARDWLAEQFMLDRRSLFTRRTVIAVEKAGLVPLIRSRFGWMDVTALSGYSSLTHAQSLVRYDVIVYAGDYDPSGLDISRDIGARTGAEVVRVALSRDQVDEYALVPMPAKGTDSRLASMIASEGSAMQVELDAMDPAVLLDLIAEGVAEATDLEIQENGWPVTDDLDAEEEAIRERLREGV